MCNLIKKIFNKERGLKMYNLIKKIFNKENGLPPIITLVIALGSLQVLDHYNLTNELTLDLQKQLVNQLWLELNSESMTALYYDLEKQEEKLTNDPGDVKQSDLHKFYYLCDSRFTSIYKNSLDMNQSELIDYRCGLVSDMYLKSLPGV